MVIFVFAILMVLIGFFPKQFVSSFVDPATQALINQQDYVNSLIH